MSLSADHRGPRQDPKAEQSLALGRLFRELRKSHTDAALLPKFMRRVAELVDAAGEDAR
jgi:hypothetical protein